MAAKKLGLFIFIVLLASRMSLTAQDPDLYYVSKDFSQLIGMKGFSENALKIHFSLYEGYVKNTNWILLELKKSDGYIYGALKHRLGWEMDGMKLHESYFENLGGKGKIDSSSGLYKAIVQSFGSYGDWEKDFKSTGLIRGIGWVVLFLDPMLGKLFNLWIEEHDTGPLVNGIPILVMDVWEHAYLLDYGTDRTKYIQAFFDNINWNVVQTRYEGAQ